MGQLRLVHFALIPAAHKVTGQPANISMLYSGHRHLMQAANVLQVRVLKTAGGRIQLTQKSEDERKQQSDMSESGIGAGSSKKARNTLEAALAKVGFKHTPEPESEVTWLFSIGQLLLASGLYVCVHQPDRCHQHGHACLSTSKEIHGACSQQLQGHI